METGQGETARLRSMALLAGIFLACAVGFVDLATGFEISLGLFYLIPIALVTWYTGLAGGLILSGTCAIGMFVVDNLVTRDIPFPSNDLIPYWNTMIRLGYFVVVAAILSALKRAHERVKAYARQDYLTGVANSQAFDEVSRVEIARARQMRHPVSVAYMDCDNFKQINDRFGHYTGDELLRVTAQTIISHLRKSDMVARLGGDEFGVLLPDTGVATAKEVIQKVQQELLATMAQRQWPVTFSIGVVTFITPPDGPDEAIRISDQLMYLVKSSGKNSVVHQVFDRQNGLTEAASA